MSGRRMLRDIMTVSDVYQYADLIMEMLREDYGSYDADELAEVLVEETFAQRLAARGYEIRPWGDSAATEDAVPAAPPAPAAPAAAPGGEVVPVTIVRNRRTPSTGDRATGSTPPPRARRTTSSGDSAPRPAGNGDSAPRPKAEGSRSSGTGTPAPRARRTTRTPRNNGDSEA